MAERRTLVLRRLRRAAYNLMDQDTDPNFVWALVGHGIVMETIGEYPGFEFVTTAMGEVFIEYADRQFPELTAAICKVAARHPDWVNPLGL